MEQSAVDDHPVRLVVTDDLQRNRLTVFFRLLLAIPHVIVVLLWGIAVIFALLINWIATLITAQPPESLHRFLSAYLRYNTHVTAYAFLLADPWPNFVGQAGYPIDLQLDGPNRQSRLGVLFRGILSIPAVILAYVFRMLNQALAVISWFYALATGRVSEGMRNLGAYCLRYEQQAYAYQFVLTGRYPSLGGAPAA
jgi:hypothetical protein